MYYVWALYVQYFIRLIIQFDSVLMKIFNK